MNAATYASIYPLVNSGGLFLVLVGVAIMLGAIRFQSRNVLLALGAVAAAIATAVPAVSLTRPHGIPTVAQVSWLAVAVFAEVAILAVILRRYATRGERELVLAILLVVAVHFLPMTPAFGPLIAALALLCLGNSLLVRRVQAYPLRAVWALDGGLKVAVGAMMWAMPRGG